MINRKKAWRNGEYATDSSTVMNQIYKFCWELYIIMWRKFRNSLLSWLISPRESRNLELDIEFEFEFEFELEFELRIEIFSKWQI